MNRLIDAKELINERPENLNPNMDDEIKSAYNKGWNACNSEWISTIKEQPTAYDTDKVIEQFKECSFRDPYGYGDDLIDIGYAIEIVKDGCEPRKNLQELIGKSEWIPVSESADCTHKECEHYGNILYTRHEVACIIADLFGGTCACDYSGNDEWLPQYCDFAETVCPNTVGVACWEQYLSHIDKKAGEQSD